MANSTEQSLGKENIDTFDKLHCFGSRWFCIQMQEAFDAQGAILREIAYKHGSQLGKSVFPLIHGLHTTSDAITLLRRDGLLNEAHVLMRLLIERALTLCYVLVTRKDGSEETKAGTEDLTNQPLKSDDLIEFAKAFRFAEAYDSKKLEEKIVAIAAQTKIPIDFLRLIVASHFPQASLALSGSARGAVFHLFNMSDNPDEHINLNFATLLFAGVSLLNYTIRVLGEHGIPENLVNDSDACNSNANAIMKKGLRPPAANVRDAYGWWQTLADHEYRAAQKMAPLLREYEVAFSALVEAGMEIPMLANNESRSLRMQISALYLKRLLNDVRSMWLMMRQGNTSQAGSIAASLFENALMIQFLAEDESRAVRLAKNPTGRWPWDKRSMCVQVNKADAKRQNKKPDAIYADAHYQQYEWLCQIKHATLGYVSHDSGSTQIKEKGYLIMPFPDVREGDWPVKRKIFLISLHNAIMAIDAFARGGKVGDQTPNEIQFASKMKTARTLLEAFLKESQTS